MSQDIFQMRMDDIVAQCPGVLAIHNVFIYGKDDRAHDANITNLFNIAQKGLIFNSSKCSIKQDSMTFFGGMFSAKGYSPDPEKIQGIIEMTSPQTKQKLVVFRSSKLPSNIHPPPQSPHRTTTRTPQKWEQLHMG